MYLYLISNAESLKKDIIGLPTQLLGQTQCKRYMKTTVSTQQRSQTISLVWFDHIASKHGHVSVLVLSRPMPIDCDHVMKS